MHIWSLSQHLIQMGHKVIVITHSYGNRKGVRYMGKFLKVYYCPYTPMSNIGTIMPTLTVTFPLFRQIVIRERIDIVHAHQATSVMANECVVYSAALGIPTVYTDHSLFQFDDLAGVVLNRVLETTLTSTVHAAICVSHACRDNFILRAVIDPRKVYVIPNAVDASKFTPNDTIDQNSNNSSNKYISDDSYENKYNNQRQHESENCRTNTASKRRLKVIVVSRLVYRKGVDLLVGIIPKICNTLPDVDFIIGGDGNKLLNLQEMIEGNQLQDRVQFLGAVPHKSVSSVLRRGHVFLNCSLTESFCIAILEAASCGLLVVSTNVGGVPEVLEDDMCVLCDPNVDALIAGLTCAIKRQKDYQRKVDPWDFHRRIERMYSWHRVAVETVQVYEQILRNSHEPMTFLHRIRRYQRLGGLSGIVVCGLVLYIETWIRFIEWIQPTEKIDVVPDLVIPSFTEASKT